MSKESPVLDKTDDEDGLVDAREPQQGIAGQRITLKDLLPQITDIAKVAIWLVILVFVIWHWSYFANWLSNATHVEFPGGFKIDRFVQASRQIEANAGTFEARNPDFRLEFAQAAIIRAERVAPAINGALVLWVDSHRDNNQLEQQILGDLGIRFVNALSTKEAMQRLDRDRYDLIISNIGRQEPHTIPLSLCKVHYFDFQTDVQRDSFKNNLLALNAQVNSSPPGGFSFMEQVVHKYGQSAPPIIFYTGTNGGKVATLCSNTITNRMDILLQSVVSHLEEQRWKELQSETPATQPGA